MNRLAKLDIYDYNILPGLIMIKLSRTNDPILVDIMSDIHNSNNRIYIDGEHFIYKNAYEVVKYKDEVYLELAVIEKKSV